MKFKFKFKSILHIRRYREKEEQQKLGLLLSERRQLKKKQSFLQERMHKSGNIMSEMNSGSAQDFRQKYMQKQELQKEVWELRNEQKKLDEKIKNQRKQLIEANKRTQIMEKLEDRERKKFIEKQQYIEQLQQNEIATQMHNRVQ